MVQKPSMSLAERFTQCNLVPGVEYQRLNMNIAQIKWHQRVTFGRTQKWSGAEEDVEQ